jgi:tetratricopeptide (TPR) repeat protein
LRTSRSCSGRSSPRIALFKAAQYEEANRAFAAIVARLEEAADPALRKLVVHALSNISNALGRIGRIAEAVTIHEDLVNRFGLDAVAAFEEQAKQRENRPEPEMREEMATALMKKAMILSDLDHDAEARAALTDLIRRFEDDEAPTIKTFVAAAYEARAQLPED